MQRILKNSLLRYCIVGAIGFFVDGGLLLCFTSIGTGPYVGRIFSIILALIVTWYIHRKFTFKVKTAANIKELLRYILTNSLGALVNYAVYSLLMILIEGISIIVPLVVSSIVALIFNYIGAKVFVFAPENK